jgi:thymidine kinase
MRDIVIGDEVYYYPKQLVARVEDVFPAAVCVKVAVLSIRDRLELFFAPQLWRADDIENLSVCRYCGSRDNLWTEREPGIPFRLCDSCRLITVQIHSIPNTPPDTHSSTPAGDS